jgi:hypothetical protein
MSEMKFATERTRALKASGELEPQDAKIVDDIERFGCSIVIIGAAKPRRGWAFTLGVTDTCGAPELIVAGLKDETASRMLNAAVDLQRRGIDLSVGRYRELVGEVECEFRPVDRKWLRELMGWAVWYNDGDSFPVLQAVYPDLDNRFPEDEGFNDYFRQPRLQPGSPMGALEEEFWSGSASESGDAEWRFPDPPSRLAFLSKTVSRGEEQVTFVSHDRDDGAWQFLGDSMSDGGGPVLVCLHHPIDADPTLQELADLPVGWVAERAAVGEPWVRSEHPPYADEE